MPSSTLITSMVLVGPRCDILPRFFPGNGTSVQATCGAEGHTTGYSSPPPTFFPSRGVVSVRATRLGRGVIFFVTMISSMRRHAQRSPSGLINRRWGIMPSMSFMLMILSLLNQIDLR
ncbi:hypothetical protein U1Q18_012367 [Sarracenia purpurea var. burkii]